MDSSHFGWGIHFDSRLLQDLWMDHVDAPAHINVKELMTLCIFLKEFLPESPLPLRILWWRDSTMHQCHRQGGWHNISPSPSYSDKDIGLSHMYQVQILPVYLPSEENLLTDAASPFQSLLDWNLRKDIFRWGSTVSTSLMEHLDSSWMDGDCLLSIIKMFGFHNFLGAQWLSLDPSFLPVRVPNFFKFYSCRSATRRHILEKIRLFYPKITLFEHLNSHKITQMQI